MPKTETPKPPDHRTYPRGKAPAPPKPPDHRTYPRGRAPAPPSGKRVPTWTRAVPPDRSFPRT